MSGNIVTFDDMQKFENNTDVLIIDVREPEELQNTGKIGGSINIPLKDLQTALKDVDSDEFKNKYGVLKPSENFPVVFTCQRGGRAAKALSIASELGFTNAKFYKGSWIEWEEKSEK